MTLRPLTKLSRDGGQMTEKGDSPKPHGRRFCVELHGI